MVQLAISIDRGPAAEAPASAWVDEDDEALVVDVTDTDRLKKLKYSKTRGAAGAVEEGAEGSGRSDLLTGQELSSALRERYQMKEVQWATTSAEDTSESDNILHHTGSMVASGGSSKDMPLPKGRVQLQRVMDANASEPCTDSVTTCQFSSSGELMVVGGMDRWLRVFKLDEEEKSEKILGTRFNEMPILDAKLLGTDSSELIVTGRKPYFYSYDLESGIVTKIRSLMSSGKGLNSHETMSICPDGSKIAFAGAGGYVHLLSGQQKTWMSDIKMNSAVRAINFASDSILVTAGLDAEVYTWDMRYTAKCLSREQNADGTCVSSIRSVPSAAAGGLFTAVGSESGVVTLYNSHCKYVDAITDSFNNKAGIKDSVLAEVNQKAYRDVMNLTTKITSMAIHPTGQMLAIASDQVYRYSLRYH